jgi:hypothetical protein
VPTLGSLMTARAMAMRCFCPPLSVMPPSPSCKGGQRAQHGEGGRAIQAALQAQSTHSTKSTPLLLSLQ